MKQLFFYSFTASIILVLVASSLVKDGMFMDGMLYACVSHNLAQGLGTFWYPYFSETTMSFFHEQPPLMFGLQSLFFKVLGSSMYTERIYSFIFTIVNAFLIVRLWKAFHINENDEGKLAWMPVLLWIVIPVCHWSFANNMEEVTMGVFVSLSILFTVLSLDQKKLNSTLLAVLAGVFMLAGFLTKGFPALYVVSFSGFYWLLTRKISFIRAFRITSLVIASSVILFCVLTSFDHIRHSLFTYMNERVFNSIANVSTGKDRFYIVRKLFLELILPGAICLVFTVLVYFRSGKFTIPKKNRQLALTFFLTGLSGTLPLMVTLEQRGFYFVTTLPFFAIGLGLLISRELSDLVKSWQINNYILRSMSVALLIIGLATVVSQIGKTRRNKEQLQDLYKIGAIVPSYTTISVNIAVWNDWATLCHLVRYYNISCDANDESHDYFLVFKSQNSVPENLIRHNLSDELIKYDFYYKPRL